MPTALSHFFQLAQVPANHLGGTYDLRLVLLSYLVAVIAAYIALDVTGRLRDIGNTKLTTTLWLIGGAFAMGASIWSMHFIGMLAFKMDVPMNYDFNLTILSLFVAILASAFAFLILSLQVIKVSSLVIGGIILGLAIASMHYIGMAAMDMEIHYLPSYFFLSILIAILASNAALWLALKSNQGSLKKRIRFKMASALIMGAAICGMHYTGMAAAVFYPSHHLTSTQSSFLNPEYISMIIALVALLILGVAFAISTYKEIINYQSVKLAHESGMAEVATNVLHNVGNVLNSVNVSASTIEKCIMESEIGGIIELSDLINQHKDDLNHFITSPTGAEVPNYIHILSDSWKKDSAYVLNELKKLIDKIGHIKEIIATQQSLSIVSKNEQVIFINDTLDEALLISNINTKKTNITIEKKYVKIQPILLNKVKLMQILINLIRNAKHSLIESKTDKKLLILEFFINDKNRLFIKVIDNGVGIPPENLSRIFTHGFTTKKEGHGFGLHSSANTIKEMGGIIQVHSDGIGKGAIFTLDLPYSTSSFIESHQTDLLTTKEEKDYADS